MALPWKLLKPPNRDATPPVTEEASILVTGLRPTHNVVVQHQLPQEPQQDPLLDMMTHKTPSVASLKLATTSSPKVSAECHPMRKPPPPSPHSSQLCFLPDSFHNYVRATEDADNHNPKRQRDLQQQQQHSSSQQHKPQGRMDGCGSTRCRCHPDASGATSLDNYHPHHHPSYYDLGPRRGRAASLLRNQHSNSDGDSYYNGLDDPTTTPCHHSRPGGTRAPRTISGRTTATTRAITATATATVTRKRPVWCSRFSPNWRGERVVTVVQQQPQLLPCRVPPSLQQQLHHQASLTSENSHSAAAAVNDSPSKTRCRPSGCGDCVSNNKSPPRSNGCRPPSGGGQSWRRHHCSNSNHHQLRRYNNASTGTTTSTPRHALVASAAIASRRTRHAGAAHRRTRNSPASRGVPSGGDGRLEEPAASRRSGGSTSRHRKNPRSSCHSNESHHR